MSNQRRLINYTVACVDEFAEVFNLDVKEAYRYLRAFKGIEFLKDSLIITQIEKTRLLSIEKIRG